MEYVMAEDFTFVIKHVPGPLSMVKSLCSKLIQGSKADDNL